MYMKLIGALACAASVATSAQATCWTPSQVAAAKVRDLDTMLMVSALRCRLTGSDLLVRYNAFVTQDRVALTEVNDVLRAHFADTVGKADALTAYDNYVTKVANRYGAGVEGLGCADMVSIVDAAANEKPTFVALSEVAERAKVSPVLDGQACPLMIASAAP